MKKHKYVKRNYATMRPMEVYDLVRTRELKKFPNNYLDTETIKEIVRHVFMIELRMTRKDIIMNVDHKFMMKYNMGGFRKFFDMKNYNVINYCFPEMQIKPWEFCKVEPGFWDNKQNQEDFLYWVIDKENLNINSKEDVRRITARMIIDYGGTHILKSEPDFYSILSIIIGNRFKEWEVMKVRVWKEERAKEAIKWLVEEKKGYSLEQACTLTVSDFKEHNLDGLLQKVFNHSILDALNFTYGNCFVRDGIRGIKCVN